MEKKFKVIIILQVIIILILGGYLVYDKFIAKDTMPKTIEKKDNNLSTNDNTNKTDKNTSTNDNTNKTDKNTSTGDKTNTMDNNTNNQSSNITIEADEEIVKSLFINDYLLKSEIEKPLDYRIDDIEVLTGSKKQEIVNMGYQSTDIFVSIIYSVKVNDVKTSYWNAGNGEGYDGQWILRKSACVVIRDGKLYNVGTSF